MHVVLCQNKDFWDGWFDTCTTPSPSPSQGEGISASFLQSWEWGEILLHEGKTVERLQVVDGGEVVAQGQIVFGQLLFGWRYGFCGKGPVVKNQESGIRNQGAIEAIAGYIQKKKCIFFRFEPSLILNSRFLILRSLDINPRATTLLDLTKTDDELLAAMHPKTRYNIRLAEKKGLRVSTEKNFAVFLDLMKKTGERDGFRLHGGTHYEKIFASDLSRQLTVFQGEAPVATAVFVGFGDTYTYLYGASDHEYRQLMATYLIQWNGILTGKKLGYRNYDFFGIAPEQGTRNKEQGTSGGEYVYDRKHQYAGVTRFKVGFGGAVREDPGTYDVVISKGRYYLYEILRVIRRLF